MHALNPEHLFRYQARLHPPQVIGPVAEGIRINFWIAGGEVLGPRIRGTMAGQGADFLTLRRDGVAELNVQGTIETDDGALIHIIYPCLSDLGADAYEQFLKGHTPPMLYLKTVPRLRCAHPAYADLERCLCVGVGEGNLETLEVTYDVYAIRGVA